MARSADIKETEVRAYLNLETFPSVGLGGGLNPSLAIYFKVGPVSLNHVPSWGVGVAENIYFKEGSVTSEYRGSLGEEPHWSADYLVALQHDGCSLTFFLHHK